MVLQQKWDKGSFFNSANGHTGSQHLPAGAAAVHVTLYTNLCNSPLPVAAKYK